MPGHDIIVLGASAGGVEALAAVARALPRDLPAAVFVVLHVPAHGTSVLPAILGRVSALRASHAVDGEPIEHGRIYVAPPDRHLLLRPGRVHLSAGPKENSARPAIDALMRTAARAYGPRVVGVVLSGNLDDGTAGLVAVKALGGVTIVQDPDEALFDGMPRSAMEYAAPDELLPVADIGRRLAELAATPVAPAAGAPDLNDEVDLREPAVTPPRGADDDGSGDGRSASSFTCPECHGALWEVQERDVVRFQCRVGHRYSADTLVAEQEVALEAALWTALRSLEESAALSRRLAERAERRGHHVASERFRAKATDIAHRAGVVREALRGGDGGAPRGNAEADTGATVGTTLT